MGFFSFSLDKPGRGVDPNEPQKRSFFRFFELFFRKFTRYIKINLLYSLTMLPTFAIVFLLMVGAGGGWFNVDQTAETGAYAAMIVAFFGASLFASLFGIGPATAGVTYILRNYVKEEHAWIWSDFKDTFKANFKQSLIVYGINVIALVVMYVAIMFYAQQGGVIGALRYLLYMVAIVFAMMNMYIYPMMVTFNLSLKDLYRNSFIFAVGKFPSNFLILVLVTFVHLGLPALAVMYGGRFFFIMLLVLALLEVLITQSFTAFMINFNVYPKLKKYMLDMTGAQEKRKETSLFEDDVTRG